MADQADVMRYYAKSAGDLSGLRIRVWFTRWQAFSKVHEAHLKAAVQMAKMGVPQL